LETSNVCNRLEDAQPMKSFRLFITEAAPPKCGDQSKFVWRGAVKETALCNWKDGILWQGAIQSVPLLNIKGGVIWEGALQAKAIGNFKDGVLWEGMIQKTPLCNLRENTVWLGAVQAKAVCNFGIMVSQGNSECNYENLFMWRDMVRSEAVLNSNTKMNSYAKLALAYWFLIRSKKSVNKKTASGGKPKAVQLKSVSKKS
jgi:hypothetical protein